MKRIVLLYEEFIPSVRLCGYEQLRWLSRAGLLSFTPVSFNRATQAQCREADVILTVRTAGVYGERLLRKMKEAGKYLVYILDDDILNVPSYSASYAYLSVPAVQKRIRTIMGLCDALISPSGLLLKKYGDGFEKRIRIEEPCLARSFRNKNNNGKIRIGFAGSADRQKEFSVLVTDALQKIKNRCPEKIEIELIGTKPEWADGRIANYFLYREDYKAYQELMAERNWTIGLAPLEDTEFNHYKYYNKYIEYGGYGIVGVYSNVYPYTEVIQDGVNGFLCENTAKAWEQTLLRLIGSPELLEKCRNQIRKEMLERYEIGLLANRLLAELPELQEYQAPISGKIPLRRIRAAAYFRKGYEFLKRNRLRSGSELARRIRERRGTGKIV